MSKQLPSAPALFSSYEQAIADLYPRIESHFVSINTLAFAGGGIRREQLDKHHTMDVQSWFSRTEGLPRPWPDEYQQKLFMPLNYLPKGSKSLAGYEKNPKLRPKASPLRWLAMEHLPSRRRLVRMLVEDLGIPPHLYLSQINATLLGASAYTLNAPALKIMLRHTSPPESRLITRAEHLSENSAPWLIDSNLIHRVVQQYAGLSADAESASTAKSIETVGLLIKHDPQAMLEKNGLGQLPDHMDVDGALGQWLSEQRRYLVSKQTRGLLKDIAGYKRSSSVARAKPKI